MPSSKPSGDRFQPKTFHSQPALPGMVLLKAFADTHPHSFEFIRPEDFVHFKNEAFTGIEEWDRFARHCLSCHACQEL